MAKVVPTAQRDSQFLRHGSDLAPHRGQELRTAIRSWFPTARGLELYLGTLSSEDLETLVNFVALVSKVPDLHRRLKREQALLTMPGLSESIQ